MDFANYLLGLASRPLGYIFNLEENVRSLRQKNEVLKADSEDVKRRVEREEEEERGAKRTKRVENWLGKVQEFTGGVDQELPEAEERSRINCLSRYLPQNCRSSYNLGKSVDRMLNEATELQKERGEFSDYTSLLPSGPVPVMPMDETVGLDVSLNEVWKWLVDETQVGVLGLFGPGGVGKTTLMKRIKEKLSCASHGFDVVIWVVVSREVNEDNIRDTIRRSLRISDESWNQCSTEQQRVDRLYQALTQKKFVLLIDDVWERLDLRKIGVHRPSLVEGSKVVFTTRLKRVCNLMKADETFEVQCLTREEALKLFEMNVGKSLVDFPQEIRPLAMKITEECKGLPLALITVGRAMAGKEKLFEWTHALRTLENNPHRLEDMEEKVYRILEFSYNSLKDDIHRTCFLYCCLSPEDYLIRTDRLIELWIGEGLLRDTDVYSMRDEGEAILEVLKRACLLESQRDDYRGIEYVKMHDVIRDMATWIACDRGQKENKLLVIEKEEDMLGVMISKWGEAEKVSLWGHRIKNIDRTPPQCSKLKTLFIRGTSVTVVPRGFFQSMAARLTLLDLSYNSEIKSLPEEICDLINLQYLNLSGTCIEKLPKEIKKLTRLRWLLLDDMARKIQIPTGAIVSLPLNVLSQWRWNQMPRANHLVNEEEIVEELGGMEYLADLSIVVYKSSSTLKIFQSSNIRKCIRRAWINDRENELTSISISYSLAGGGGFSHLQVLYFLECRVLREMEIPQGTGRAPFSPCFPNLVDVWVEDCDLLLNLSWLVHAPKVRKLCVGDCGSMEKIIGDGITPDELAASGLFSCLQDLRLYRLPKLTSICDRALSFPPRASFRISYCHGLRKLPFHPNDARGRRFCIEADASWWAEFEWDPAARVTFQLNHSSHAEEMAFGEAVRKVKDERIGGAKIGFGPSGSGQTKGC